MKIAIYGYGRMGKMVEEEALARGHEISSVFEPDHPIEHHLEKPQQLHGSDAVISFTRAEAVMPLLELAARAGVPVVEGTTGWYGALEKARRIPDLNLVYSPNFSIGVYLFTRLVRETARLLGGVEGYDAYVHEKHHSGKADSPSGTARQLAEAILEVDGKKQEILAESCHGRIRPELLHVTSTRAGRFPGTHEVGFDSDSDLIQVTHTAHGRQGFVQGAVSAAEWITNRKGIYSMDEFMESRLAE